MRWFRELWPPARHENTFQHPKTQFFLQKTMFSTSFPIFGQKRIFLFENQPFKIGNFKLPRNWNIVFMVRYDGLKNDTVKWNFENGCLPKINFPKKKMRWKKNTFERIFFSGRISGSTVDHTMENGTLEIITQEQQNY